MNANDELPLGACHEAKGRKISAAGIPPQILRRAGALGMLALSAALRTGAQNGTVEVGRLIQAARSG